MPERRSRPSTLSIRLLISSTFRLERIQSTFWSLLSITAVQEKTQPESEKEETSRDRQSMSHLSEESIKEFTSSAASPERKPSKAQRTSPSAWPMKSSSQEPEMPTLRLLRRRRKSREEPRQTDD